MHPTRNYCGAGGGFWPILLKKSEMIGPRNFFASQARFSEKDVGDLIIRF